MQIQLQPLTPDDREQFIRDNQDAFNYGALEKFGRRDDHFEEPDEIISRKTIEQSIDGGSAYRIWLDGEKVGGLIVKVNGCHGDLEILFVNPKVHSKGIGQAAWREEEKMFPEVEIWETCTPYFEKRNIHFYVNRCGFHIVEFFNKHHPEPDGSEPEEQISDEQFPDGMFRFEKRMCPGKPSERMDDEKHMNPAMPTSIRTGDGMSDSAITIRFATEKDVPFIKACIHELAEYEHSAELDKSTEEMLHEKIFAKGFAKVLIAECNGEKAGFALWFNNFSTWLARPGIYLEDLLVRPQFRRKGIGKRLLKRLAEIAMENGWGRVEWACLKWNKPSLEFYESLGAIKMDEWVTLRLADESLERLGNEATEK